MFVPLRIMIYAVLITGQIVGIEAATIQSSEYFPLADGNSWTYSVDGLSMDTMTVLSGTELVNGVATKALQFTDGSRSYYTSDSNGVSWHREFDPYPPSETTTFSPPVIEALGVSQVPGVVDSSGIATLDIPDVSPVPFVYNYTYRAVFEAFETITVPAGRFETVRSRDTLRVFGTSQGFPLDETFTWTDWSARYVGPVKSVYTDSDGTQTYVLLSTNVTPPFFKVDIVIDFGSIGLWSWMNDAVWLKLSNSSPDQVVTGDVDGNGEDDVIADFGSTLGGIFIKRDLGGWTQLHNFSADQLAPGDLDNSGKDDVVVDFGGIGLWARMNDASWLKLHNASPEQVVVADMDGSDADDVIAVFPSGIFVKRNLGGWAQLHNFVPELMAVGDLDDSGKDDLVIDFGGIGLWARMNDASWLKLHNSSPELIATGDVDGNGAGDVLATFSGQGFWQKLNLGGWSKLSNSAPDAVVTGDVTAEGRDDIVGDFGSTLGGIFVKRDQGAWVKLHNTSPESMAVGNLDGI